MADTPWLQCRQPRLLLLLLLHLSALLLVECSKGSSLGHRHLLGDGGGAAAATNPRQWRARDRILVRWRQASSDSAAGSEEGDTHPAYRWRVVRLRAGEDPEAAQQAYALREDVELAELDSLIEGDQIAAQPAPPAAQPSDPDYPQQWALQRVGAALAWNVSTGDERITVCIADSGIEWTHPDLAANIAPARGWNMVNQSAWPVDEVGHGTHVAGILGAVGNNGVDISGVNWKVELLACKFLDARNQGFASNAAACIQYCVGQGARIIQASWSSPDPNQALTDAIEAAGERDVLFISTAGNLGLDLDAVPRYPASLRLPNMLVVASSGYSDELSSFSSYGNDTVHLAAPGEGILSTWPNATTGYMTGTSQAAPLVAGAAALLLAASNGRLTSSELRQLLLDSAVPTEGLQGKVATGGRLSIDRALALYRSLQLDPLPPQ